MKPDNWITCSFDQERDIIGLEIIKYTRSSRYDFPSGVGQFFIPKLKVTDMYGDAIHVDNIRVMENEYREVVEVRTEHLSLWMCMEAACTGRFFSFKVTE